MDSPEAVVANTPRERFMRWRRILEVGFWLLFFGSSVLGNSLTLLMDADRVSLDLAAWKAFTWEATSAVALLLLLPVVAWFTGRYPLHVDTWRRRLPLYLAASVVWSLAHVLLMVGMRKLVYAAQGLRYDFGHWPAELYYEYLKDIRTFVLLVILMHAYRLILRRWQGEVSVLSEPDDAPLEAPVERPERFLVRKLGREFLVAARDIEWAAASGNYVNLRVRGRDYPLRSTLAAFLDRLDPDHFARVHRSFLVNLDQVASIEPLDSGDARVHMRDGETVPCSRRYREFLRGR